MRRRGFLALIGLGAAGAAGGVIPAAASLVGVRGPELIVPGTIDGGLIVAGTITARHIAVGSITANKIDLDARAGR